MITKFLFLFSFSVLLSFSSFAKTLECKIELRDESLNEIFYHFKISEENGSIYTKASFEKISYENTYNGLTCKISEVDSNVFNCLKNEHNTTFSVSSSYKRYQKSLEHALVVNTNSDKPFTDEIFEKEKTIYEASFFLQGAGISRIIFKNDDCTHI